MAARLACVVCLFFVSLSSGCKGGQGGSSSSLSGQVTFKDVPLTGGGILVVSKADGQKASGRISADGSFSLTGVPAGELDVAIETQSVKEYLEKASGLPEPGKDPKDFVGKVDTKGQGDPVKMMMKANPFFGVKFVAIPAKYADPKTSGLSATMGSGKSEKNFSLKE